MSDVMFPEPLDAMERAMQRMDKKAWAEADAEIATLKARLAEAERDAARYRWLKAHYYAADFFYDDVGSVLIFDMGSQEHRVSADLNWTVDEAMKTSDSAPAVTPFCGPFPEQSEDERTLRYMLAIRCGEPGELYGDDGELQLGGFPYPIDFRRDSVAEIRRKLDARGMAKLAAQLQAADSAEAVPCKLTECPEPHWCKTEGECLADKFNP